MKTRGPSRGGAQTGKRRAVPTPVGARRSWKGERKATDGTQAPPFDRTRGNCAERDPDEMFVQGAAQTAAKKICNNCPIKGECLADALDNRIEFGLWGGMTERERRALLKRHPSVTSWRKLFESQREARESTTV